MKITAEDKLKTIASYLKIEYEQKIIQSGALMQEVESTYKTFTELFKLKKKSDEDVFEVVKKFVLKPILEKAENKFDEFKFFTLDVDDEEEIAKRYRIFSVPTVVCFKNGKKIDSLVGLNPYDDVIDFITRCNETKIDED